MICYGGIKHSVLRDETLRDKVSSIEEPELEIEMVFMPNEKKNPISELMIFQPMHI